MQKLKKVLRPGGDKDDEVMYGTSSKVGDQAPKLSAEPEAEKDSGGILSSVLGSGDDKQSGDATTAVPQEETTATSSAAPGTRISNLLKEDLDHASTLSIKSGMEGPYARGADTPVIEQTGLAFANTDTQRDESNLGPEAPIEAVGTGAAEAAAEEGVKQEGAVGEGIKREDNGDDVSKATYTARSYPLTGSSPSQSKEPVVDSSADRREPEEQSSTARDTSLAGAGTLIGAGAVGAGALAAQENKDNADDVEQATYTDRSYPVGSSSGSQEGATPIDAKHEDAKEPEKIDSVAPHVPGEFPTESGEDPHVPGEFPADRSEKEEHGLGSGAAIASAMGLTVGGAAAGAAVASSNSDDTTKATERDLHPGGQGFPYESSQTSDSNAGRDAAIVGGAAAATGVAGGAAYEATRGDDRTEQVPQTTTTTTTETEKNPSTVPEPQGATKDDEAQKDEDSNLGRNAAIAGGAAAATGAGAAGLYYATKDSTDGPSEQDWPESPRDVGRDHAKNLKTVPPGSPEKNPSRAPEAQQTTKDDEAQKEEEDSNLGRNAAIAGGATAAAGAGGAAAYYATKDDEPQQTEEKKGLLEKAKEKKDEKQAEKQQEKAEKERKKEEEKAEKEREKAEKERKKEEEKKMTKEQKKEEERRKREEWEKLNAERLAAYQRGDLGPEDVLKDGHQPIADKESEGPTTAEDAIAAGAAGAAVAGAGGAAYAATRDEHETTRTSSERKTSTGSERRPSIIQKILHPNKTRKEEKERRASLEAGRSSQDTGSRKESHVGTEGPIGDDTKVSGQEHTSSSAKETTPAAATTATSRDPGDEIQPVASSSSQPTTHLEVAEGKAPEGYITITHPNADPNAPTLIVREP